MRWLFLPAILIADYAAENLDGIFVGAHSRVYDRPVIEKWFNVSSDFGWVLFGLGRPQEPPVRFRSLRGKALAFT